MARLKMTSKLIAFVVLAGVFAAVPVAAGDPLLSGYGGPGQGEQRILGSALVGGAGGGGPTVDGSNSTLSSGSNQQALGATGTQASTAPPTASGARSRPAGTPRRGRAHGGASAPHGAPAATVPTTAAAAVGSSPALGLSGVDLVYITLGLAALVLTAVLTRLLARQPR